MMGYRSLAIKTTLEFSSDLRKELFTSRGTMYKIFEGALMESIFKQLHQAYIDRSRKRSDAAGGKWNNLAPDVQLSVKALTEKDTEDLTALRN